LNTSPCQWGMGANAYFNHHRIIWTFIKSFWH
jgi:hypothetical protein